MYQKMINQRKSNGPWLLSEETLIKMDSLMTESYDDLAKCRVKPDGNYYGDSNTKTLTIWFKNVSDVSFRSFKEALVDERFFNKMPIKFEYTVKVGDDKISIALDSSWMCNDFQYYIQCKDHNTENNILYAMDKIYSVEKPKALPMLTSKIGKLSFLIYFILLLLLCTTINYRLTAPFNHTIKSKIYQILLKEELQQEDYFEIIKYTAIKDLGIYDLIDGSDTKKASKIYGAILLYYLTIGFLLCTIISLNPKASFAIGKGKHKVRHWKSYYKFIYYAIPIVIILPIFVNIISNIITMRVN
jgi:hypothetical protein